MFESRTVEAPWVGKVVGEAIQAGLKLMAAQQQHGVGVTESTPEGIGRVIEALVAREHKKLWNTHTECTHYDTSMWSLKRKKC